MIDPESKGGNPRPRIGGVILAGPDEEVLMRAACPVFHAAGFRVQAVVSALPALRDATLVALDQDAGGPLLVVVDARVAAGPDEALQALRDLGDARLAVILPQPWQDERERFTALSNLVGGYTVPPNWPYIVADLARKMRAGAEEQGEESEASEEKHPHRIEPAAAGPAVEPPPTPGAPASPGAATWLRLRRAGPRVRLGLYGTRGGVGVSTVALAAARALAAEELRVALFDARRRGDLHLMAGVGPIEDPIARGGITLFLDPPTEEVVKDFDAAIVDGGRERGDFNGEWVAISKPLSEDRVRRLVGLEPKREKGTAGTKNDGPKREGRPHKSGPNLGRLISIEVTD